MEGILGRKVGMTQIYVEDGTVIPVTVIKAGPCLVVQRKTAGTDGYEAVQIGLVEEKPAKPNQPQAGHFKKAGVAPVRKLEEFRLDSGEELKAGDEVKAKCPLADAKIDAAIRSVRGTARSMGIDVVG